MGVRWGYTRRGYSAFCGEGWAGAGLGGEQQGQFRELPAPSGLPQATLGRGKEGKLEGQDFCEGS